LLNYFNGLICVNITSHCKVSCGFVTDFNLRWCKFKDFCFTTNSHAR